MSKQTNVANEAALAAVQGNGDVNVESGSNAALGFKNENPISGNAVESESFESGEPVVEAAEIPTVENLVTQSIGNTNLIPNTPPTSPRASSATPSTKSAPSVSNAGTQGNTKVSGSNVSNTSVTSRSGVPNRTTGSNTRTTQTASTATASTDGQQASSMGAVSQQGPAMHPGSNLVQVPRSANVSSGGGGVAESTEAENVSDNQLGNTLPAHPKAPSQARRKDVAFANDALNEADKQKIQSRSEMYASALTGREEIRREGVIEKPEPVNFLSRANRRFQKSKQFIQAKVKSALKGKSYSGTTFYETLFSDSTLRPNEVSIGSANLLESLREPNSYLLSLVNRKLQENGEEQLDQQFCLDNISVLVDAINRLNIEVVLEKTPVNVKTSVQVRTLRAHYGRGIGIHPTQAKAYNADFDGDEAFLNLDQSNLSYHSRAMTMLVDAEGNPTIDPDFFPIEPIDKDKVKETKDALREDFFYWNEDAANQVWSAYRDLCNQPDPEMSSNKYWVNFLRRIDSVAGRMDGLRGENASDILKAFYDFSVRRRALSLQTQFEPTIDEYDYSDVTENVDPFVLDLQKLVRDISAGKPAPNLQDFTRFYNKYYGDVTGRKNVPFRLLADFAKAINRTDLISIGSDISGIELWGGHDTVGIIQNARENENSTVTIQQLWQFTCAAGLSKQISGRMHMGSRTLAVSTQVRKMVLQEVPIPTYITEGHPGYNPNYPVEQQFRDWINAFIKSYNRNMRMLNISQISFRNGMIPVRDQLSFDGINDVVKDLPEALVKVYGEKTVETLFPTLILSRGRRKANGELMAEQNTGANPGVVYSYRNMSIEKFAINNRISFKKETVNGQDIPKFQAITQRVNNGTYTPMDILMLVADRRTKQTGEYHDRWMKATEMNMGTLSQIRDDIDRQNYNSYVVDMLEFMHLMSPNMFDYYGMDSPISFINSKWGNKLIHARSIDEFRSHLVSMMVEYRLNKASKILDEIEETRKITGLTEIDIEEKLESLDAAFELEMNLLGSSSMAWDTIVKEAMDDNRTFLFLLEKGGLSNAPSRAAEFWNSPNAGQYGTLLSLLKSSESFETKMAVLADVTRVRQQYYDITSKEMLGQLAHHPDRVLAGPRFDMDGGLRGDLDSLKESVTRISSYRDKTPEAIKKESTKLLSKAKSDKVGFAKRLKRFSDDPGYMVHVDTILAADAISSIYDKTYGDSEKNSQQAAVNGYFGAVSLQRSGGYYTHLQQTDNAVVNMIGYDQLTVIDIVRILGNPDIEVTVYDEFGCAATVSRLSLCGGNTIEDVIRYLEANPRISLACRRFIAGVGTEVDGKSSYISAMNDMQFGDDLENQVFSLFNDRPRFLAIAALCTPSNQDVGRNITERINDNLQNLCRFIASEAASGNDIESILADAERILGINPDTILEMKAKSRFGQEAQDIDYDAVSGLYSEVMEELLDCIGIVRQSDINIPSPRNIEVRRMNVDESSIVSYYDARQQLNGARTDIMIEVEGAETKKNIVLKEYLRHRPDKYTMRDGKVVLSSEALAGKNPEDLTLEHNRSKQVGSICKFLEVKREKGAETFNLKAKKYGDDGTNSIIKFIKMGMRSMFNRYGMNEHDTWAIEDSQELLDKIAACKSKDEAVPILAQALIEADRRLKYTDEITFVESDYWNRADLMLAENVAEDGSVTLVVRTIEQLSVACRNRLSDQAVASGDANVILSELENIVNTLGTNADPMAANAADVQHRCLYNVRIHSSKGNIRRVDRALRQRSSSVERNYTLVNKMFKEFKNEFGGATPPSQQRIEERSKSQLKKLKYATRKKIESIANTWSRNGSYDYLGRASDPTTKIFPGPQNLVLFDTPPFGERNIQMLDWCEKYGVTAAFDSIDNVPSKYLMDVIWTGDLYILPFFDMRLNGSMSDPIMPAPAVIPFNPDNMVVNVEDTTFEFKSGDASYHITRELADRVRVNFRGTSKFDSNRLFPNVLRSFPDSDFQMDFCDNAEIQRYIVNGLFNADTMTIDGFQKTTIDLGISPDHPNYEREARRFEIRLREYADRFSNFADADGMLKNVNIGNDSIIGFVKIVIDNQAVAIAPVWPFHLEENGSAPTSYQVDKIEFDNESHSFNLTWHYSGNLDGQYIKAFEGIGASNKMITSSERAKSRTLANGMAIDGFYSTKSVASRLFASNKRIHTMISMMMMTRMDKNYAYNFAELSGAFPNNPDIKEALLDNSMSITDWINVRDQIDKFHDDPEIDAIVKYWVDKCLDFGTVNPSVLLATKNREGIMWPMLTEFEVFMDTSYNFQNAFLKLMNKMNPTLCPPSIDANAKNCLFKPVVNNASEDYGVMQMMVPHYDDQGKEYHVPENVYISPGFFGEEFSGFKKVNINGYNRASDSLNVASNIDGFELSQMMELGRAGMSSVLQGANIIEASSDAVMENQDAITSFRDEYYFLSNMYDVPVMWNHTLYGSSEAAFQAQKLSYKRGGFDWSETKPFENASSGYEAKKLGRQVPIDVDQWNADRRRIMKQIVKAKFVQNPELAKKLIATGDRELIEGHTKDTYWGAPNGIGQNNLGKILMEVREELKQGAGE